jgi:hypothetical protein
MKKLIFILLILTACESVETYTDKEMYNHDGFKCYFMLYDSKVEVNTNNPVSQGCVWIDNEPHYFEQSIVIDLKGQRGVKQLTVFGYFDETHLMNSSCYFEL